MDTKELLGFIGGLLTTMGFVPQVWRLYKLKSAREISLTFSTLFVAGVAFWLMYGIVFNMLSIIFWNSITMILGIGMLVAKLKYGKG